PRTHRAPPRRRPHGLDPARADLPRRQCRPGLPVLAQRARLGHLPAAGLGPGPGHSRRGRVGAPGRRRPVRALDEPGDGPGARAPAAPPLKPPRHTARMAAFNPRTVLRRVLIAAVFNTVLALFISA